MEESELRVSGLLRFLSLGRLDGLLNGRVDLRVDLVSREDGDAGVKGSDFSRLGEGRLDESSDLLNMSLSIDLSGFDTSLLLNSIDQCDWDTLLSYALNGNLLSFHC